MDDNAQPITPQMPLSDGQLPTNDQTQTAQPVPAALISEPGIEEAVTPADTEKSMVEEPLDGDEEDDSFTADASPSGPAA
jgi:hypothetical protein